MANGAEAELTAVIYGSGHKKILYCCMRTTRVQTNHNASMAGPCELKIFLTVLMMIELYDQCYAK